MSERDMRIPYRIPDGYLCTYEDEGEDAYVRMGDMVDVEDVCGELCGVLYDQDGFIDSVELFDEKTCDVNRVACEGFYEWLDVSVANAIFRAIGEVKRPIAETLADLIDPTCHILPWDADNHAPHCSACGAVLFAGPYCPSCGARVVTDDGRD